MTVPSLTTSLPFPLTPYQEPHDALAGLKDTKPSPLPVSNPTRSFWLDSAPGVNPLAKEGSTGPLTSDADLCIIGSGITGISAAYHIARLVENRSCADSRAPLKVVILEARDFCKLLLSADGSWHLLTPSISRLRRHWYVTGPYNTRSLADYSAGRNGGHFTAVTFQDFSSYADAYGTDEALRAVALEKHVVTEVVNLVKDSGKEADIDLVSGGTTMLWLSDEEAAQGRADYDAAKAAGADLSEVHLLTSDEMLKVCIDLINRIIL